MQTVKLQEKSGTGMLWLHIPKHIKEHFGLRKGQKVWVDWEEGNPPRMVVYFENPRGEEVNEGV
ncbi:hypothetical protein [Geoglobus ahangari]